MEYQNAEARNDIEMDHIAESDWRIELDTKASSIFLFYFFCFRISSLDSCSLFCSPSSVFVVGFRNSHEIRFFFRRDFDSFSNRNSVNRNSFCEKINRHTHTLTHPHGQHDKEDFFRFVLSNKRWACWKMLSNRRCGIGFCSWFSTLICLLQSITAQSLSGPSIIGMCSADWCSWSPSAFADETQNLWPKYTGKTTATSERIANARNAFLTSKVRLVECASYDAKKCRQLWAPNRRNYSTFFNWFYGGEEFDLSFNHCAEGRSSTNHSKLL